MEKNDLALIFNAVIYDTQQKERFKYNSMTENKKFQFFFF